MLGLLDYLGSLSFLILGFLHLLVQLLLLNLQSVFHVSNLALLSLELILALSSDLVSIFFGLVQLFLPFELGFCLLIFTLVLLLHGFHLLLHLSNLALNLSVA